MDVVSWVILVAVIMIAALGVGLWNRRRSAPVDLLDADTAKSIRDAQSDIERGPGMGSGRGEL